MSTVYLYLEQVPGGIVAALPASDNPANDPALITVVQKAGFVQGTSVQDLSDDQIKLLVTRSYQRFGAVPSGYDQVVFYDGKTYGQANRQVVYTRRLGQ
jgi:hypothetical protein